MREVPGDVNEAAVGMGMSARQRFWRVELPLALPVIASGVRLALVQVWATATIAALVAGPGVGRIITEGFARNDYAQGMAGAVVVAVVALVLELAAAAVQRAVDPTPKGPSSSHRDDPLSAGSTTVAEAPTGG